MTPQRKKIAPRAPTLLEWALALVLLGYAVFMCGPKMKIPLKGSKGFKDATKDPELIRKWWAKCPTGNPAIVPGTAGHVVLDFDGPEGIAAGEKLGLLPSNTKTVITPNGLHLYFLCPDGAQFGNKKLHPKIDVRHLRGYVMGAGAT